MFEQSEGSRARTGDTAIWRGRFGAVDVHYPSRGGAVAALVVTGDIGFGQVVSEHTARLDAVAPYQPGHFYLRELPAIQAVLATTGGVDLLAIDGYVTLDPSGRPGLGAHLHSYLGIPIIGVAKTAFHGATHAAAVYRGKARRPLYVTAAGLDPQDAARIVAEMAGIHRIPDALRRVDTLARTAGQSDG